MAHPSNQFAGAVFHIDAASQPLKPKNGRIYALTNIGAAATTLQVKSNFFQHRTTSEAITNHIDPATGELGVADAGLADASGNATAAGYYELDNDDFVDLKIQVGQTIYGKFTEVQMKAAATGDVLAYCTTANQVGLEI
jgi:hypothetical protein